MNSLFAIRAKAGAGVAEVAGGGLPLNWMLPEGTEVSTVFDEIVLKGANDQYLTIAELKRRGMAALEEALAHGPVHIFKRNRPAVVVLSADDYQRLIEGRPAERLGMTAMQWLLAQSGAGARDKAEIDAALKQERDW